MKNSAEFLNLVLDSITEHIVVINKFGDIQYVNKSWSNFGSNNACDIDGEWRGVNYIDECDKASAMGDDFGAKAGDGIRRVIDKKEAIFYFEYPCHSPNEERWFMMRVTPFQMSEKAYFVISHQNITERKLAEQAVSNLARIDGLTDIPNRRSFDEFFHNEWKRCLRLKRPISLAIMDLDHFKLLNDSYGHQYGDECLIKVGTLLKGFHNRPSDICARYGGEEFALVWGDTSLEQARKLSNRLLNNIAALNIANSHSPTESYLTASIGLAEVVPNSGDKKTDLIGMADDMLYRAKGRGKNRVES